jgi:peptidoglycan/xylan/chitin deacetylase (PgdA/CDA1 family)
VKRPRLSRTSSLVALGYAGTAVIAALPGATLSPAAAPSPVPRHAPAAPGHGVSQPRYRPAGCVASGPAVARRNGPARKEVALSFDDGPYPLTQRFVRMLRANGAVATFFMIGEQVDASYRATLREELRDGDALGDHTWSHPDLVRMARSGVRSQLRGTREVIRRESGYSPCVFRPPYGDVNGSIVAIARSLGLATILWDVDPSDWALPGVSAIEGRVLAQVTPGAIVISHDGGGPRGQTLAAYPAIIRALRTRGYRFVTVPQLLGFRTIYRRCRRDCGGEEIEGPPPKGSIVQP